MNSPLTYFGESITPMHSMGRAELEELQRAMIARFSNTAGRSRWSASFVVGWASPPRSHVRRSLPLLFSHTAYKAYPASLVDNNRWDPDDQVAGQVDGL